MSKISKEHIMEESVARLFKLNLNNEVVQNFKSDILMVSDNGKLSSIEENPQINIIKKAINEVERIHANPYHIILTESNFGFLCVLFQLLTPLRANGVKSWNKTVLR